METVPKAVYFILPGTDIAAKTTQSANLKAAIFEIKNNLLNITDKHDSIERDFHDK